MYLLSNPKCAGLSLWIQIWPCLHPTSANNVRWMYDHVISGCLPYTRHLCVSALFFFFFCMRLPCFCLPGCHVPNSNFTVTTTADEDVIPRNHSPYTHHVALQRLLVISASVIHMDLCIIHSKHNIFWREVQGRDHAHVRRNMLCAPPAFIPSRLDHVFLLEVGSVGGWPGSTFSRRNAARRGR